MKNKFEIGSWALIPTLVIQTGGIQGKCIFITVLLINIFFNSFGQISSFPYAEDFEAGAGDWVAEDVSEDGFGWELGAPAATIINAANSGVNAWVTNLTGNYDESHAYYTLTSPMFDFSGIMVDPSLEIAVNYELQPGDYSWVQISLDGGNIWNQLGKSNSGGTNWYGTDLGWTGSSSGWKWR